jgi:quercetin dioxygenase-like cupin family protein
MIYRRPLLSAIIDGNKSIDRVEIKKIAFEPGQQSGLHRHPCPVVGYVAKGSIRFQVDGEPERTLKEGDAFFEPANTTILHFDNASTGAPATFIAFYLVGPADRELIEML